MRPAIDFQLMRVTIFVLDTAGGAFSLTIKSQASSIESRQRRLSEVLTRKLHPTLGAMACSLTPTTTRAQLRPPTDEQMYGDPPWAWVPYAPGEAAQVYTILLIAYVIALGIQIVGARMLGFEHGALTNMIMALWWLPFGFIILVPFF